MVRISVLGPLRAMVDGAEADLGGPRQRSVLALLLTSRGAVVPVDRMIEDLWRGEAPARAIASLQAYVSNLRRALEPHRPARAPASILVSASPGYAIRLDPSAVDAWEFEQCVSDARASVEATGALSLLDRALGLWQGRAYAEFADEQWALAEAARLDEVHLAGRTVHAALMLRADPPAAVPVAEQLTRSHPLHEEGWRLLALALWGSSRQAEALAALRRARTALAEELGLDPGPALVELEQAVLTQRTEVLTAATARGDSVTAATPTRVVPPPAAAAIDRPARPKPLFVGRAAELSMLRTAAATAREHGTAVLIAGEPGSGKSSLLREFARTLREDGWLVADGRCPEGEGAPPAWAWTESLRELARHRPPGTHAAAVASLLPEAAPAGEAGAERMADTPDQAADSATTVFRRDRAVCAWLAEAAATTPIALALDDLHAADAETLRLLVTAATELEGQPVLLLGAYRPAEAGTHLGETLAALARRSPTRLQLGGLALADVATLVAAACRSTVDSETVTALHDRTGGNPFYVTESARLLASEGALVAVADVPEGVRDVLRRRFARLPEPAVAVLRLAAVAGRESDVDTLIASAEVDEAGVLDAIDAGLISGLVVEPGPGRVRFVHALVRDVLYTDLSHSRRARAHARIARAIEELHPTDLAGLAHHYARSAGRETARLAVRYSAAAAHDAQHRFAPVAAAALFRQAVASLDESGDASADEQVELLGELMRAEIRAGEVGRARGTRDRAVAVAEGADRSDLLLAAYAAWTEPTPWHIRPYGTIDERVVGHLVGLLGRADLTVSVRCGLLVALVTELEGQDDPRLPGLADEAVAHADRSGDPWLRALAVTARVREPLAVANPELMRSLADELDQLCASREMPLFLWFRDYLRAKAAAASNDVPAFLRQVESATEIARRYGMPEALTIMACARAAHAHVQGDFALARRRYQEAAAAMTRHGSLHTEDILAYALLTIALSEADAAGPGSPPWTELVAPVLGLVEQYGSFAADIAALVLVGAGDQEQARRLHRLAPLPRRDYFWVALLSCRARVVAALGEAAEAAELYEALLPYAEHLSGIETIAVALPPVATVLGDLAMLLGRADAARRHYEQAVRVAQLWSARHWAEAAAARAKSIASELQGDRPTIPA